MAKPTKAEIEAARRLERQKVIWDMAKKGSKIAKKMAVVQGGKK